MVNFYWEAARKAADHHMLIDFHGAYKPDGLGPNLSKCAYKRGRKRNGE
jgi:hypothetical protein